MEQDFHTDHQENEQLLDGLFRVFPSCYPPVFPPTPKDLPSDYEQGKKTCQVYFHHLLMSPHLQFLACKTHPREQVCFNSSLFLVLAGSSEHTAYSSALLLSNRLDSCVHKPNLVLEIGSVRALNIGPLTFPMALLILQHSSPNPTGKAG